MRRKQQIGPEARGTQTFHCPTGVGLVVVYFQAPFAERLSVIQFNVLPNAMSALGLWIARRIEAIRNEQILSSLACLHKLRVGATRALVMNAELTSREMPPLSRVAPCERSSALAWGGGNFFFVKTDYTFVKKVD